MPGTLRPDAYQGGSRMATEFPKEVPQAKAKDSPAPAANPEPDPEPAREKTAPARRSGSGSGAGVANDAGGFVLALLVWAWLALPLLQGGPERVRNVLRAKFVNKGASGEWLP